MKKVFDELEKMLVAEKRRLTDLKLDAMKRGNKPYAVKVEECIKTIDNVRYNIVKKLRKRWLHGS